jgi:hypothetical protein
MLISNLECLTLKHCPLPLPIGEVDLIPDQHLRQVGVGGRPVDRIDPRAHILKGLLLSQVKGDDHPLCLPVELLRDRVETFLSCRVPDLHIHFRLLVSHIGCGNKVNTQGFNMGLLEFVVGVSK